MTTPLCPYFGSCGGCTFQHLSYEEQLDRKKNELIQALGILEQKEKITIFSDKEYFYRNRMDFIFHAGGIGLRKKGDWRHIIDIDKCVISNEFLNTLLQEVRLFFKGCDYFDVRKNVGTFRYAVIRTPVGDSSISFVLNSDSSKIAEAIDQIKLFSEKTSAKNVLVTYVPSQTDVSISSDFFVVKGTDILHETFLGKNFEYSVQGFFQNNSVMAEKMHQYVHKIIKSYDTAKFHLLDLYGGVGTFGIINAENFLSTTIIEGDKNCIDAAKKNIQLNNTQNTSALVLDAMQLKKLNMPKPLIVITDPPRSGMHPKTIEKLVLLKPHLIIYVSCNPAELAKELPKFKEYELASIALFDLFPQTPHSEVVIELVRKIIS